MATIVATITLDNGTVIGTYTSTVTDAKIQSGIALYASKKGYLPTVFDVDGLVINNPENAGTFLLRNERANVAQAINQLILEQADATARANAAAIAIVL